MVWVSTYQPLNSTETHPIRKKNAKDHMTHSIHSQHPDARQDKRSGQDTE